MGTSNYRRVTIEIDKVSSNAESFTNPLGN